MLIGLIAGVMTGMVIKHVMAPLPAPATVYALLSIAGIEFYTMCRSAKRVCMAYGFTIYQAPLSSNLLFFVCGWAITYF